MAKKAMNAIGLSVYTLLTFVSAWFFLGGMFAFGGYCEVPTLLIAVFVASVPQWLHFLIECFLEKQLPRFWRYYQFVRIALFVLLGIAVLLLLTPVVFVPDLSALPILLIAVGFLIPGVLPRIVFFVKSKTGSKYFLWVMTVCGCVLISVAAFFLFFVLSR